MNFARTSSACKAVAVLAIEHVEFAEGRVLGQTGRCWEAARRFYFGPSLPSASKQHGDKMAPLGLAKSDKDRKLKTLLGTYVRVGLSSSLLT